MQSIVMCLFCRMYVCDFLTNFVVLLSRETEQTNTNIENMYMKHKKYETRKRETETFHVCMAAYSRLHCMRWF